MKRKTRKNRENSQVYFIVAESGNIKIGTSVNIRNRMIGLNREYPGVGTLRLLYSFPGSYKEENDLHNALDHACIKGEWFKPCQEISDAIEKLKAGVPFGQVYRYLFDRQYVAIGFWTEQDLIDHKESQAALKQLQAELDEKYRGVTISKW